MTEELLNSIIERVNKAKDILERTRHYEHYIERLRMIQKNLNI